jgi:hypothetical protein
MAMEDLIGQLYQYNMGLPLQYATPYFSFLNNQAGNMAGMGNAYQNNVGSIGNQAIGTYGSMGNQAMGLYGQLAGQQAQMYQSELPVQMEMAKYNSLAPVLSGLLGQFGGFGGSNISPISMSFDRPDVMAGYGGAVDNAYSQLGKATFGAYRNADNAYNRAYGDTNRIGDQFGEQWNNLQRRAFPNQGGGGGFPSPPQNLAPPSYNNDFFLRDAPGVDRIPPPPARPYQPYTPPRAPSVSAPKISVGAVSTPKASSR